MRVTSLFTALLLLLAASILVVTGSAPAAADDRPKAVPSIFIGKAGDCGPVAGSHIVTSAWLGGMGLPDRGGDAALNGVPATANDPHRGLLLSKNGPTPDCSAAGAEITHVRRHEVGADFTLGFDFRNGGHCGAGAPRFNVVARQGKEDPTFHFVGGCSNGVQTPAPQDPAEWTRTRFTAAQQFPPIPVGSRIVSIEIIFDEGTDTPTVQDPNGVGLAVIDNIFIDGAFIRSGRGIADGTKDKDKDDDDD